MKRILILMLGLTISCFSYGLTPQEAQDFKNQIEELNAKNELLPYVVLDLNIIIASASCSLASVWLVTSGLLDSLPMLNVVPDVGNEVFSGGGQLGNYSSGLGNILGGLIVGVFDAVIMGIDFSDGRISDGEYYLIPFQEARSTYESTLVSHKVAFGENSICRDSIDRIGMILGYGLEEIEELVSARR